MEIKIKFIDRIAASFFLTFKNSTTIKEIKREISNKLNKDIDSIVLKRGTEVLNDKIDLDTYEFGTVGTIEINYI